EQAARVDHRLAAVHVEAARDPRDRVVRDGEDDQLDLFDQGRRVGERPDARDEAPKPLAPRRVPAGDGMDRPAAAGQGDAEGRPDGAGPDDPDDRRLARRALGVGMRVRMVVDRVAPEVGMEGVGLSGAGLVGHAAARRDDPRIQVDPGFLDRPDLLLALPRPARGGFGGVVAIGLLRLARTPGFHADVPCRRAPALVWRSGPDGESRYPFMQRVYRPPATEDEWPSPIRSMPGPASEAGSRTTTGWPRSPTGSTSIGRPSRSRSSSRTSSATRGAGSSNRRMSRPLPRGGRASPRRPRSRSCRPGSSSKTSPASLPSSISPS